jgi:hypothetical protein
MTDISPSLTRIKEQQKQLELTKLGKQIFKSLVLTFQGKIEQNEVRLAKSEKK